MKKLIFACLILIGIVAADFIVTQKILAQTPATSKPGGLCYAQCGAYKFYWKGDFCYDMVQQNCTASFNVKDLISMLKSIRTAFMTGKLTEIVDVKPIFAAWLICKPLITDCVAPQLTACETECTQDPTFYAPNLTVGSNWGGVIQGLYYDQDTKQLTMRVLNDGLGYASDIKVKLTTSTTTGYDEASMTTTTTDTDTIPELLFFGSRQNAPPGVTDIVTDFLIDQSRFHNFLSRFKSDAKNIYIPPGWEKTISVYAPAWQLRRFTLTVDPDNQIIESNEYDNTYVLDIDKRPTRPSFEFSDIQLTRQDPLLTKYEIAITVKNSGDLSGPAALSLGTGTGDQLSNSLFSDTKQVDGHGTAVFTAAVNLDAATGSPSCGQTKRLIAVVTDEQGRKQTTTIDVPVWAGYISGRVTDTSGKPVAGATITASTGQTTTSGAYGEYHIGGIATLGKVTLTFSHPNYTDVVTKDVDIELTKTAGIGNGCYVEGLIQHADAVLRDKPLKLHIRLKTSLGPLVSGTVYFTGGAGSFTYDVSGERDIDEMEPGQFRITAMAAGYVTKEVEVVLTPPEQTIEIVLDPLPGRPTDEGLSIITPVKLWEKTIATGKIDAIAGAKNGKLLVVDTNDSSAKGGIKNWAGAVTFINPIDGTMIKSVSVPFNVGQNQVALDAPYNGSSVGFMYSVPDSEEKTQSHSYVKLFNATGDAVGDKDMGKSAAVMMSVSPDGFFLYPGKLMNKNLHIYTRQEIEGKGGDDPKGYPVSTVLKFLHNNTIIAGCKDGQCVENLAGDTIHTVGNTHGGVEAIDTSFSDTTIILRTINGLNYYGSSSWQKDLNPHDNQFIAAITNGGEYVITTDGTGSDTGLTLHVFDKTGRDVTPKFTYKDVKFVEANDRGIFFASVVSNKLTYYQIGKYKTEYTGPQIPQTTVQTVSSDLESWVNGTFVQAAPLGWSDINRGMLRAAKNLTLATPWGSISFTEGSIFTKADDGKPILLWGQAEIEANTPITMIVFKHKLYDPAKFQANLNLFFGNSLGTDMYVTIQNLHTKYTASTGNAGVTVTVSSGKVTVSSGDKKQEVKNDQTATITDTGITVRKTTHALPYIVFIIVLLLVIGTIFVVKRKKGGGI